MLGGIGLSLLLMMTERKIFVDTHLLCLSELKESSVDNHSKRHSFRFAFLIKWRSSVQFGLSATAVLSRFCCAAANLHVKRHFFQPSLLINACGCSLRGQKPVDCCVMTCSLPACLHDSHINCLLTMFVPMCTKWLCLLLFGLVAAPSDDSLLACSPCLGTFEPNSNLLASILPDGNFIWPFGLTPSR